MISFDGSENRNKNAILPLTPPSSTTAATTAAAFLSDSIFPPRKSSVLKEEEEDDIENASKAAADPLATQVWRLYTKAKDTLPNGSRLENLTWRMMAMTLNKKKAAEEQQQLQQQKQKQQSMSPITTTTSSPPAHDDTIGLLSSSAPLYNNDYFAQNSYEMKQQNVMVYGSARASSTKVKCRFWALYLSYLT